MNNSAGRFLILFMSLVCTIYNCAGSHVHETKAVRFHYINSRNIDFSHSKSSGDLASSSAATSKPTSPPTTTASTAVKTTSTTPTTSPTKATATKAAANSSSTAATPSPHPTTTTPMISTTTAQSTSTKPTTTPSSMSSTSATKAPSTSTETTIPTTTTQTTTTPRTPKPSATSPTRTPTTAPTTTTTIPTTTTQTTTTETASKPSSTSPTSTPISTTTAAAQTTPTVTTTAATTTRSSTTTKPPITSSLTPPPTAVTTTSTAPPPSTTWSPDIFPPSLGSFQYKFPSTISWDIPYPDGLDDKRSKTFENYKEQVENGLSQVFSDTTGFKNVNVDNFIRGCVIADFDILLNLDTAVQDPGVIDASLVDAQDKLQSVKLEGALADSDYIVFTTKPAIIKELQRLRSDDTKRDVCNSSLYQSVCPGSHLCVVTLEDVNSPITCQHRCLSHSCTYMGSDQFVECVLGVDYSPFCRCKDDALLVDGECVDEWQVIGPVLAVGLLILILVGAALFYRHRARGATPSTASHVEFNNPIDLDPTSSY